MSDTNINKNDGSGSATTVLVTVIIVAIIGAAFYFGFLRGNWGGADNNGGTNIDINATVPAGSGIDAGPAE